jgi:predicted metal-binding protein
MGEEEQPAMSDRTALEAMFQDLGYTDFRWINPADIVVAQWVRMKCRFGCREYGRNGCCPPSTPSVEECRQFFSEYTRAVVFHFEKAVDKPEDRHEWSKGVNAGLVELERAVFMAGHQKTFLLFMDSCGLCTECSGVRELCNRPREARPAPEAMAVDVFSTVRKLGYPIQVLAEYSEVMNRYAFLLID